MTEQANKPPHSAHSLGNSLWQERLESIKAAVLSGITLALIAGFGSLINPEFMRLPTIALEVGVAGFSGGLFGITYRHLVSQNLVSQNQDSPQNEHLKSGAIGAFALVRGLAQAELFWVYRHNLWAVGITLVESFVLFGVAALILDLALKLNWVKPFQASP
jgi:divalent metal cation (Fe/Co/Zn/Cd) transporter